MKKRICAVVMCVFMMLSMCACSKDCKAGCGEKANPKCGAGMCDSCCSYFDGFNGCMHTEFN